MNPIGSIRPGTSLLTALRTHDAHRKSLATSLERLSTGYRINRGADDPAGLITSENLRAVLATLEAESRTLQRADHVATTADAAMGEISDLLVEAEGLAVASANTAGMSDEEIAANRMEMDSIVNTINRIAGTTTFNGDQLLDGTATLSAAGQSLTIESVAMGSIGEGDDAQAMLAAARANVSEQRAKLGAFQKHTIGSRQNALGVSMENIAAANSVIRDTDYGRETANLARLALLTNVSLKMVGAGRSSLESVFTLLS